LRKTDRFSIKDNPHENKQNAQIGTFEVSTHPNIIYSVSRFTLYSVYIII